MQMRKSRTSRWMRQDNQWSLPRRWDFFYLCLRNEWNAVLTQPRRHLRLKGESCALDGSDMVNGAVVGRIYKANAAALGTPWMWTRSFGHHEDRTPTHGYEPTRELP